MSESPQAESGDTSREPAGRADPAAGEPDARDTIEARDAVEDPDVLGDDEGGDAPWENAGDRCPTASGQPPQHTLFDENRLAR